MSIKYLDFDLLIERSFERYRARVLDSPAGEASAEFAPPFSEPDVDAFFLQIGQTRSFETEQTKKILQFGQSLFEAVFTGPVRDSLRASLGEANVQGAGLRIRLRLADTPELGNLPWEFIYDPGLSRFLALSVDTPVVRYLETPQIAQPFAVQPPLRIMAMICGPKDFPRLDVEREWENLQASLKDLQDRGLVDLRRLSPPTLSTLQQVLRRGEYHIFHFVGHGVFSKTDQDGFLLLENELGEGQRLSGRDLGTLLHDERSLRLAVLNACEGARSARTDQFAGTAQSLIQQGIPAVIAMQFRITDKASITLAHEFYGALADGYPVDAALTEARKAIKTEGNDLEWGTPVLYMRSPDGQIFDVAPAPVEARPATHAAAPETADSSSIRTGAGKGPAGLIVEDTKIVVDPGRSAAIPVTLLNRGSITDHFQLSLSGIPYSWIKLPPAVQLMPGQKKEVTVSIQPPRSPESRAGSYPIPLSATAQESTGPAARAELTLIVEPFSSFNSRLLPEKIQAGQTARISIENQGNLQQGFTLDLQDQGSELAFEPPQTRVQVKEGETAGAEFRAQPKKRRLVGNPRVHPIRVQVRPEKGEPQILTGEVLSRALIPAWMLPAAILITAVVTALICLVFVWPLLAQPQIRSITHEPQNPSANQPVTIFWEVSRAQTVTINGVRLQASQGQYTFPGGFASSTTLRVEASNSFGRVEQDHTINVSAQEATDPVIELWGVSPSQLTAGETVVIQWQVSNAESVEVQPFGAQGLYGAISDVPEADKTYTLIARNKDKVVTRSASVTVSTSGPPKACVPSLVSPLPGAVMDNGRTDKLDDEVWDFDWSDCTGASAYELYVIGQTATIPVIDVNTGSTSSYHSVSKSYIIDSNRFNWTWKVRAMINGQWGAWSETRTFDVEPVNSDPGTAPPLSFAEDCLPFNTDNAGLQEKDGNWWIAAGGSAMLYFGPNQSEAGQALGIIQHYRMNNQCFVGRPNPSLEYWLANGASPAGPYSGEDCISFNPSNIQVVNTGGRWKILDGTHAMLDFADAEDEARKSYEILQHYGFDHICYVGRPDASMTYFRR